MSVETHRQRRLNGAEEYRTLLDGLRGQPIGSQIASGEMEGYDTLRDFRSEVGTVIEGMGISSVNCAQLIELGTESQEIPVDPLDEAVRRVASEIVSWHSVGTGWKSRSSTT